MLWLAGGWNAPGRAFGLRVAIGMGTPGERRGAQSMVRAVSPRPAHSPAMNKSPQAAADCVFLVLPATTRRGWLWAVTLLALLFAAMRIAGLF